MGTGLLYVGMNAFAFADVPGGDLAVGSSLFYMLRQRGGSVGVALCALEVRAHGDAGAALAFLLVALVAPLSILPMRFQLGRLLGRSQPQLPPPA